MNKIYKYSLNRHDTSVQLPAGANVVHAAEQNGTICLWAMVDPDKPLETRKFSVVGTGWDIEGRACYIATVHEGPFVWHILEVL